MHACHGTRGISEHALTIPELRRSRLPTTRKPLAEQLRSRWTMAPRGDRRDRSQSRRVEGEKVSAVEREDHIMSVLILGDDLLDLQRRRATARPGENVRDSVRYRESISGEIGTTLRDCPTGRRE